MSMKLKALGLGLLAVLATSAFAVVNASATSNGHFVSEATEHHLIVKGTEQTPGPHTLEFYEIENIPSHNTVDGKLPIKCTHASYHGTLTGTAATTTNAVQVRPEYKECSTGGTGPHDITVHVPTACGTNVFEFTSGGTGTVGVNCTITITHPNCEITVPAGQKLSGVTYTTTEETGKHALTLHVNVKTIKGEYHGKICVFLGTTHYFEMVGSVTVWAENTAGGRVGITHT